MRVKYLKQLYKTKVYNNDGCHWIAITYYFLEFYINIFKTLNFSANNSVKCYIIVFAF